MRQESWDRASWRTSARAFVRLGRLKFLLYSLLLFGGLGSAAAVQDGHPLDLSRYLHGQAFIWCVHLMTNYCNEYFDLDADTVQRSPTRWTGGSRVLVEGLLSPRVSLGAAFVFLFTGVVLVTMMPDGGARWIALSIVALAWFYVAPPFRFNYVGLGEVDTAISLNLLCPLLAYHLQARTFQIGLLVVLAPIVLVQHARMMVMNLSDHDGDKTIGKRTLAVILGPDTTVRVFTLLQITAYGTILVFLVLGRLPWPVGVAMLSTTPLSAWLVRQLRRGAIREPRSANSVVFWASSHVALMNAAATCGIVVDTVQRLRAIPLSIALCSGTVVLYLASLTFQIRTNAVRD